MVSVIASMLNRRLPLVNSQVCNWFWMYAVQPLKVLLLSHLGEVPEQDDRIVLERRYP